MTIEVIEVALKDRKEERMETRLPAEAKLQIEQAAAMQGRSVSDFVVQAALDQASKVIEQQRIVRLTVDESTALAELMLAEPKPNAKAMAAIRRYRKSIGS